MTGARTAKIASAGGSARGLYDRIGEFLTAQRLDPEPGNYAFAHAIVADPDGPLARAVWALTDGGVRLTRRDIETLGGDVVVSPSEARKRADGLVARTQMQVESFDDTIHAIRAETKDFGRELAASAAAILRSRDGVVTDTAMIDEIARITASMVDRVAETEAELESATRETAELRAKLEEARDNARRDPLTDLPNRRAFEEAFTAHAAAGTAMCVGVCDVDHFKSVNDRFGHVVGDRVLKTIGGAIAEACSGHLVARYGGEEFVVLFTAIDVEAARVILNVARAAVSAKRYLLRETDEPLGEITFSAGVSPVGEGEVVGSAFHRADRLLYAAKKNGRNQVA